MSKLELLSAGFSAILGKKVVLKEGEATYSIHDVLNKTYVMKPPEFSRPSQKRVHKTAFPIYVEMMSGVCYVHPNVWCTQCATTFTLLVTKENSVLQVKRQIEKERGIPVGRFDLNFNHNCLDEDRKVKYYGLQPENTIFLVPRLKGGGSPITVSTDELDPDFDCDFTRVKDDGIQYMRGGFRYKRPYGWNRVAIRVRGRYEDDDWLGYDGIRTSQASGEWPVSYHGTDKNSAERIVEEGYKIWPRAKFGKGIYTSPSLEMVEKYYAQKFSHKGKIYKIALQNRVNPDREGHLKIISVSETGVGAQYWLSPKSDDVRPYGVLFREIRQTESESESDCSPISTPQQPMSQRGLQTRSVFLSPVYQSAQPRQNNQTRSVSLSPVYQSAQPSQENQTCCRCFLM